MTIFIKKSYLYRPWTTTFYRVVMKNVINTNKSLLQKLQEGDEQAFITIFDCYHRLLYAVAFRYLKSAEEAEDAVQHTYMRLWERRLQLEADSEIRSFLFTILKNHILNELRHKKVVLAWYYQLAQEEELVENNIQHAIENKDFKVHIQKAIHRLPEQKKMICFLKIEKGLSNQEIADKMEITIATVKSHYTQALKLLRKELEGTILLLLQLPFF